MSCTILGRTLVEGSHPLKCRGTLDVPANRGWGVRGRREGLPPGFRLFVSWDEVSRGSLTFLFVKNGKRAFTLIREDNSS